MNLCRLAAALLLLQLGTAAPAFADVPTTGLASPVELAVLPQALLPQALVRQQINALKAEPLRFAVPTILNLDERNGSWDAPTADTARWRLQLSSDGARSLALRLSAVQLPEGATLWFYDAAGRDIQGPFDRHSPALHNGEMQLPVVRSSVAVLEVLTPTASRNEVHFKIAEAYHGYREFSSGSATASRPKAAIGSDSGSCNINVACVEGNDWRNEIRSTVLLTVGNQSLCSGSLVNNTSQNNRPLILTANHCNIRDSNVVTVTAYFNVQSASCNGNDDGPVNQNIVASTFLARDQQTDFTLFALATQPPPSFTPAPYYAGWDARTGVAPQTGVTIHHPIGDEKKISVYNSPGLIANNARIGDATSGFNVDAWRINWARGTTEAGSSGSALWNQNRQLVGVLSGGGASCDTPNEPDFFARLERGWQANSAASGQLKAHLDPGNTGCLQLASKNQSDTPAPLPSCGGSSGGDGGAIDAGFSGGGSPGPLLLCGLMLAALARRRFS